MHPVTPRAETAVLAELSGTYTLSQIYKAVQSAGPSVTQRNSGNDIVWGASDSRWKHRVRGALASAKRRGTSQRVGPGVWLLRGTPKRPRGAILISLDPGGDIELRVQTAAELLQTLDEPADLVLADPPYKLGVGQGIQRDYGLRCYQRDPSWVMGGYQEVPDELSWEAFLSQWIPHAANAIRPGGYLARIGLFTKGPLNSPARVFNCPPELPRPRNGRSYPHDIWPIGYVPKAESRNTLKYANTLPTKLVDHIVGATTRPLDPCRKPDLVVDPFLGGGTSAIVAKNRGLRFVGGDTNYGAVRFTMGRLSETQLSPSRK
jgi:hypothetical protein